MHRRITLLALIAALLSLPLPCRARETITVDPGTVIQANFLGVNAVHHGFSYLPESVEMGMTPELRALELARVKESGIRIARTFYRPDWAMGDGPWLRPDWNSPKMKALYAWLADLQTIGVDVALNMGWWFPRDVIWNRDQHLPTYPDDLHAYCRWLSASIHEIIQVRGFTNVKYLVMFTEPNDMHGNTPGAKPLWGYYKEVLQAANRQLLDDGLRQLVKIVGPNTSVAPTWLDKATAELNDVIDIYASHNYNFTTYQQWSDMALAIKTMVAPTGKPFWIDEYGVQDSKLRQSGQYGTVLALANAAFMNAGAQSSMLWILNDQYYPAPLKYLTNGDSFLDGKHSWGLFPWLPESRATRPAWDAFVLLSRFMGQAGSKVVKTQGASDLPIAATTGDDGGLNLLVVNGAPQPREVTVLFPGEVALPLYRHGYSPLANPRLSAARLPLPASTTRGQSFDDALQPGEVVIYSTRPPGPDGPLVSLVAHDAHYASEGMVNLALRQKVEVSSADSEWPKELITDGKRLTSWRSAGQSKRREEEVTIDLGSLVAVRKIAVFPDVDRGWGQKQSVRKDLWIKVAGEKREWRRISGKEIQGNANGALIATMPPQPIRYIRIGCKAPPSPDPDGLFRAGLGEVKVFAGQE
jgi:hypothetical protein